MKTKQQMAEAIQRKFQSLKDTDSRSLVSNVSTKAKDGATFVVRPVKSKVDNYIINVVTDGVMVSKDSKKLVRKYDVHEMGLVQDIVVEKQS